MHRDHAAFVDAIHSRTVLAVSFASKEDGKVIVRSCAPLDFGPSRRAKDQSDRYHLWDYDSDTRAHVLSLLPDQIQRMEATSASFDPTELVTWDVQKSPWFLAREWGHVS